jgi:hypothetical protein
MNAGLLPNAIGAAAALVAVVIYAMIVRLLASISDVKDFTAAQAGAAVGYGLVVGLWAFAEAGFMCVRSVPPSASEEEDEEGAQQLVGDSKSGPKAELPQRKLLFLDQDQLKGLRLSVEFVAILGYIYLCDRTDMFSKGPKQLNKFGFWALNGVILLAAAATLRRTPGDGPVKPLQRDQTEEWKGWMQIMFILYHYFNESEIYNAIRLYIAAYVWMTGFGNFSYYYIKKDFTLLRFVQMMWRLNFFVFFVCVTMNNEYMLYYICPMHTFFTWLVYLALFCGNQYNESNPILLLKIGVTIVLAALLYDVPGVFHTVMSPFKFLLDFHDPLHPEFTDALHEWFFRSGLDHLVWIFGMFCAFSFPWLDNKLQTMEELPGAKRLVSKAVLTIVTLVIGGWWYYTYFTMGKRDYNKVHPFTSFIPIFCYMVLRNITPVLRRYHMHLFAWTGKITLETYILQFHIWMKTTGLNGSPKHLMVWIPGFYWLNFVLISVVYLFVSYRVFIITASLRDICIPRENILSRFTMIGGGLAVLYGIGFALKF